VVGSAVVNEAKETVGTIDDLIVTPTEMVPLAVLSVADFLGMATKYVYGALSRARSANKKKLLAGATKASLNVLSEFKYVS
jgi:hypothetical protein